MSFDKDTYRTPRPFVEYYERLYAFGVDLFASDENYLFNRYYTKQNSFLDAPASDVAKMTCWANPPYSRPKIYVKKMVEVFNEVDCTIVALLPIDFSTEWFELVLKNATEIHYIVGGRIPFIHPVTGKGDKYDLYGWKNLLVSGHTIATKLPYKLVTGIEGELVNVREQTSMMGVKRMASLIEYTTAWGVENGVHFNDRYGFWGR